MYSGGTPKNQTPTYVSPSNGNGYGGRYKFNAVIDDNYYYAQNGNCAFIVDSSIERDMHTVVFLHISHLVWSHHLVFQLLDRVLPLYYLLNL